jgi:hypothetical protein
MAVALGCTVVDEPYKEFHNEAFNIISNAFPPDSTVVNGIDFEPFDG